MKKTILIVIFICSLFGSAVLGAGLINYQNNKIESKLTETNNLAAAQTDPLAQPAADLVQSDTEATQQSLLAKSNTTSLTLSASEVAKHNNINSCWMIILGKVYDVTATIGSHPGGTAEELKFCGKDATTAFATKDNVGRDHSSYAYSSLASYYIGDLNQTLTAKAPAVSGKVAGASTQAAKKTTSAPASPVQPVTVAAAPLVPLVNPIPNNISVTLSAATVAQHNNLTSCWMIVSNKVYDVTSYVNSHPGGVAAITAYCGKDGTAAFVGIGHSANATSILASFYLGDLNQVLNAQPAPIVVTLPVTPTPTTTQIAAVTPTTTTSTVATSTQTAVASRRHYYDDEEEGDD